MTVKENSGYEIPYKNFKLQKMVDGVLIRLYHCNGSWKLGTSKMFDAEKSIWTSNRSFHDLFIDTTKWPIIMGSKI